MYEDNPASMLTERIRYNTLSNNPYRDSIIGTTKEINKITKEDLETCYHTFYHPSNMFLVVTGSFDVEEVMKVIRDNQNSKSFPDIDKIEVKAIKEEDKVYKDKEIVSSSTVIPKVSYTIKLPVSNIKLTRRKLHLYLYIIFTVLFDETSIFDERLKKEGIINNTTYVDLLNCNTHILISLISETKNYEAFLEEVKKTLENITIDKKDFDRKKKVLISNELFSFENIEVINDMIVDNIIFNNTIENNMIDLLKSLNIEELNEVISNLNLENKAIVILKK